MVCALPTSLVSDSTGGLRPLVLLALSLKDVFSGSPPLSHFERGEACGSSVPGQKGQNERGILHLGMVVPAAKSHFYV